MVNNYFVKLSLILAFVVYDINAFSQTCPICVIDLTCDSVPTAPKLCPTSLPTDTAQQYYEADITFYIPQTFDIDSPVNTTIDLNRIDVVGLSGLPAGLTWTSYDYAGNDTTSFYPPSNPPLSLRGCAKICGTPLLPGNYIITVSVLSYIYVYANSSNMIQPQSFDVLLTILPSTTGNSVYTMTNSQGCDSITTSFSPILQSSGSPLYTYSWDFGDSTTGTNEFPNHTYNTPGYYVVSLTMDIYQYVLTEVDVTDSGCNWAGDIEELTCWNSPDLYFIINDGTSVITLGTIDDDKTPTWSNIDEVITGNQFTIEFWDEDLFTQWDDLGSTVVNFPGAGTYNYTTSGDVTGTVTIEIQLDTTYIDTDTVYVYSIPVLGPINIAPNDSVCAGDSITLAISGGDFYQWYEDTNLIPGAIDSFYIAYQSGNYWVEATNSFGCTANSSQTPISVIPNPQAPTFFFAGNNTLQTFSTGPNLQWHLDSNPIPGANLQTLQITVTGNYSLTATNSFGCVSYSDTLYATYVCPTVDPIIVSSSAVCVGDSITLSVSGGIGYQWYNDTNLITGAIDSFYVAYQSGDYWVEVSNNYGCTTNTAQASITVAPYPTVPAFSLVGNNTLQTSSTEPNLQWYLNGNPIPGANQQTHIMTDSGYYHLIAANAFGCASSSDTLFFDYVYVGIDESKQILESVRLLPNPNNGQFDLSFTTFESQNVVISISDIFGRLVYYNEPGDIHGQYSTSFNLENINSGLYLLKVSIGDYSINKKLVIH